MSTVVSPALDAHRLRADFPVFEELFGGKPLAYLDSASSAQKPRQVLDRMRQFYEHEYANVHRGVYRLAERATEGYEGARRTVARLLNAPSDKEIVFTRSATERIISPPRLNGLIVSSSSRRPQSAPMPLGPQSL